MRALISRRLGRTLGQGAHLAGDDREAAALLAGTRGFHRGVERQDVGLEGDAVDGADDVGDLARGGVDLVHGGDDLRDHRAAALGRLGGGGRELVGLARESALCLTVPVSCSMELAVCCRLLAVCSVRALRSWLPLAISALAVPMFSPLARTCATRPPRKSRMLCSAWSRSLARRGPDGEAARQVARSDRLRDLLASCTGCTIEREFSSVSGTTTSAPARAARRRRRAWRAQAAANSARGAAALQQRRCDDLDDARATSRRGPWPAAPVARPWRVSKAPFWHRVEHGADSSRVQFLERRAGDGRCPSPRLEQRAQRLFAFGVEAGPGFVA